MLFINENENNKLYKYFFKNTQYKIYDTDNVLIIKIKDNSNNLKTKVVKMICKLK